MIDSRAVLLVLVLALAATAGCVKRQVHLTYTDDLASVPVTRGAALAADDPITSELLVTGWLLGRDLGEVGAGDLPVNEERLDQLFGEDPGEPDDEFAYRLVHFTDVQLRNRMLGFRPDLERAADQHLRWTVNNWFQDHADVVYMMLALRTMRAMLDRGSHHVVVHTGDAVHINHPTEVEAFATAIEVALLFDPDTGSPCRRCWAEHSWLAPLSRARGDVVPAFRFVNTLGNHDVLRWGVWSRGGQTLMRPYPEDIAGRAELSQTLARIGGGDGRLAPTGDDRLRGYFTVDVPNTGASGGGASHLRLVVLDTGETNRAGHVGERDSRPAVSPAQRDWLAATLTDAAGDPAVDHVIVLGHVPLWKIHVCDVEGRCDGPGALEPLLRDHPVVVAYLSGHWHSGVSPASAYLRARDYPFAHVALPSMMEFPKILTSITVRKRADGSYVIAIDPLDLADLGLLPPEPTPDTPSIDVRQDPTGCEAALFAAWLRALDARCGDDVACRAIQVATDGLTGARADRPGFARHWLGPLGPTFHTEIVVDR